MSKGNYEIIPELKPDEKTVREIVDRMQGKYNELMDEYEKEDLAHTVSPIDTFMIMHNFHKLSVMSIANTVGMPNEYRIWYYKTAKDTFSRAMDELINKLGS